MTNRRATPNDLIEGFEIINGYKLNKKERHIFMYAYTIGHGEQEVEDILELKKEEYKLTTEINTKNKFI